MLRTQHRQEDIRNNRLLIEPFGIEITKPNDNPNKDKELLIEPFGIEMRQSCLTATVE